MAVERVQSDAVTRGVLVLLTLLPLPWAVAALWPPLNHDAAGLLYFATRMAAGERLYVDLLDVNPPMIFWLDLIPAFLARWSGLPPQTLFILFVTATALACAGAAITLLRALPGQIYGPILRALTLPTALFVVLAYPLHSFGQREHLLLAAALPYIAISALRWDGPRPSALASILACIPFALAIGMKPHFAMVIVLIETALLIRRGIGRSLADPVPWTIIGTGLLYLAAIRLFAPSYLTEILPVAVGHYAEDSVPLGMMLTGDQIPLLACGLGVCALFAWRGRARGVSRVLSLFVLGAMIAAAAQGKGWDYHFLVARGGLILLGAATLGGLIERLTPDPRRATLSVVGLWMAGLMTATSVLAPPFAAQRRFPDSPTGKLLAGINAAAQGQPVLVLSSSIYPHFPLLLYTNSRLAMPFMSLWLLPAEYRNGQAVDNRLVFHAPEEMDPAEADLFRKVAASLAREKPALILVANPLREGYGGRFFDYLGYFSRDPGFAEAVKSYRETARIEGWTILTRQAPQP